MENISNRKPVFDEEQFIFNTYIEQQRLFSGAESYLLDLKEYIKGLEPKRADCANLSFDSLESTIDCARAGSVLGTQMELSDAKHFNVDIPRYVLEDIMKAAVLGGLRNFVMNIYLSEPEE